MTRVMERVSGRGGYAEIDVSMRGAELEIGQRLSKTWTASGYAARTWRGQLEAGGRLRATW